MVNQENELIINSDKVQELNVKILDSRFKGRLTWDNLASHVFHFLFPIAMCQCRHPGIKYTSCYS